MESNDIYIYFSIFPFLDELVKEKSQWETEVATLKKQLEQQSTLCKYIDKTSDEGKWVNLCNRIIC